MFYENFYVSNPWDYSYQIRINGIQIASGNTNESQNTTVSENVTQYYSIIVGKTANVTASTAEWEPGYAAYQSVWFVFYHGPKPSGIPNVVVSVPINRGFYTSKNPYPHNVLIPYNTSQVYNVTFPDNVTAGYINFYALQNGNDEGWYANQPPFREFVVSINGTVVARMWPYPNVQTGGWNLFLWQPIHAIGALLDKPYTFNIDPYISLIHGKKTVNVTVVNDEDQWIRVALNFMLYTGSGSVYSTFNSTYSETNVYVQTPQTNMTTESIPYNATWLNDTQKVHEMITVSSMEVYDGISVKSYENITNFVSAYSNMYDPSFNIVLPYGDALMVPYTQVFGYTDMINVTFNNITTTPYGVFRYSYVSRSVYTVSMDFVYDTIVSTNGTVEAIILGDTAQQGKFVYTQVAKYGPNTDYVNVTTVNDQLAGTGAFEGVINNGVIVKMDYNHANTWRTDIYTVSVYNNGAMRSNGYETIQYAVNYSTINRDGVYVIDEYIIL